MDGVVVIGEGEKDEAPMLYIGEQVGNGSPPAVDVAVDPIDGTRLVARGIPGGIATVALAERGSMFHTHIHYMEKLIVGPAAAKVIDITASVTQNLKRIARAEDRRVEDLTVVVLDRERHDTLLDEIRSAGARVKLIMDGDVAAGLMAAMEHRTGIDVLMGIGGAPEAVLAACGIKCIGGGMQARIWLTEGERSVLEKEGKEEGVVLELDDLVARRQRLLRRNRDHQRRAPRGSALPRRGPLPHPEPGHALVFGNRALHRCGAQSGKAAPAARSRGAGLEGNVDRPGVAGGCPPRAGFFPRDRIGARQ